MSVETKKYSPNTDARANNTLHSIVDPGRAPLNLFVFFFFQPRIELGRRAIGPWVGQACNAILRLPLTL